jgi:hypothetical protein
MADFPTLVPNAISFDHGQQNLTEVATFAGPIRFRHSARVNRHTLQLTYQGLTQAQVDQIRSHYANSDGTHRQFDVPAVIWGGLQVVDSAASYRYAGTPQEEHTGLHYNVSVALRIIDGLLALFILDGGGATQPALSAFTSLAFTGTAPFILDCDDASPTATLLLQGGGANQ